MLHLPAGCMLLAFWLGTVPAPLTAAAADQATVWSPWEQALTSVREHANPYRDVTLRVTYTGPEGRSFTAYGFWDGNNTHRIRAAFPAAGEWKWETACSDAADTGLHGRTGRVTVTAYTGDNPIQHHGFLKVSDNHRHLAYADGTPFLWIGDTPWSAFMAASADEWSAYLDNRRANGFTVVQVHCGDGFLGLSKDRAGHTPFTGTGAGLQSNPDYWRGVEEKIRAANERGLLVYICAVRQPAGYRSKAFPMNDETEVARFARHLAARLMGSFVMYSPMADDLWSKPAEACARALRDATSQHLLSAHPRFLLKPALESHAKDYIDVVGLQTGEGWQNDPYRKEARKPFSTALAAENAYYWPLYLYQRAPAKPVINQEGPYDHPVHEDRIPLPPRKAGYWTFLNGAPGLTYGCFGIWNWGRRVGWHPAYEFEASLTLPSVAQMKHLAGFLNSIPWWSLEPRPELVPFLESDPLRRIAAAASPDGRLIVAYLPDNASVQLELADYPGILRGRWFNPLTADYAPMTESPSTTTSTLFTKPAGWEDAVLLLERTP